LIILHQSVGSQRQAI